MISLQLPSRLTWTFWPEKEFTDVYENIYVRTLTKDWFVIICALAKNLKGHTDLLDVGCGEGHTTKQVLDRIGSSYICDLMEPNAEALSSAQNFLKQENIIGAVSPDTLRGFVPKKEYDAVFTSHTNYYWAENEEDYKFRLEKFIKLVKKEGKALMLTLPADSDQYKVLLSDPYKHFVRAEYAESFYKDMGYGVETVDFSMRMYVGDFFTTQSLFDVKNFYRFLHGVEETPSNKDAQAFLEKIKNVAKDDYLDFKDRLIVITRRV